MGLLVLISTLRNLELVTGGVYKGYQPEQPIYFSHKINRW